MLTLGSSHYSCFINKVDVRYGLKQPVAGGILYVHHYCIVLATLSALRWFNFFEGLVL